MPTVRLINADTTFPAADGETILAAALRAGMPFPYSCQAGNCGSCKCVLVEGEVLELEYSDSALSVAERMNGTILACRAQVFGEILIQHLAGKAMDNTACD